MLPSLLKCLKNDTLDSKMQLLSLKQSFKISENSDCVIMDIKAPLQEHRLNASEF